MMREEFEKLTGFFPTMAHYEMIEQAYMACNDDKQTFCLKFMKNENGIASSIQRKMDMMMAFADRQQERAKEQEAKAHEKAISEMQAKIDRLTAELELEQEWKPFEDEHNVKQADYENLEGDKFTKVLTDEEAASLIANEFGFVESKVKIIHEIDKEEVNRHGQCRRTNKYIRKALFNAWDWNYIRFNVCGMAYEMHDGELKLFWH